MNRFLPLLAPLALAALAPSQNDTIYWTDGTVTKNVTVTGFNLAEVKFRHRGSTDTKPAEKVARLDVTKVKDEFRRSFSSSLENRAGNFLRDAEKVKSSNPFLAQFAYVEAAKVFLDGHQYGDAFAMLQKLNQECPNSGFLPMLYRVKLEYYLVRDKASDAAKVASDYWNATQTQGFPAAYAIEADFYKKAAEGVGGSLTGSGLRAAMNQVITQTESEYPDIANKARLYVGQSFLDEDKFAEAKDAFQKLLDEDFVDNEVLSRAWLGLGHVHYASADPTNTEPYREALLACLHVYTENQRSTSPAVAEALELGEESARKWGGENSSRIAGKLRNLRQTKFPNWGK